MIIGAQVKVGSALVGCPERDQLLAAEPEALSHARTCPACQSVLETAGSLGATFDSQKTLRREGPADDTLAEGSRVGAYLVSRRLGAGAMGTVYAAFDPRLEREVALKVLHVGGDLVGEARLLARLNHPNVVTVYEVLEWQGRVVLVMELVQGLTMRHWLQARPRTSAELRELFTQCAKGLAAAHAQGVVHRDFKPDNVLVDESGRARLLDFGLAAPLASGTFGLAGSPAYMALAQLDRAPADAASDQFSWWAVLYEALTGRLVHDAPSLEGLIAARRAGVVDLAKVPPAWRRAVARGLSNEPSRRFGSMDEAARALAPSKTARWAGVALVAALGAVSLAWSFVVPAPCELTGLATALARTRAPALAGAVDAWHRERDACLRQPAEEQREVSVCLTQAGVELDLALEAVEASGPQGEALAPRLLRRVMPAARCAQRPLPPVVRLETDRGPLVASLRDQLAFDALRVADDVDGALALAREQRSRVETGSSATARLWAGINEASALSATGDARGALDLLRSLRGVSGAGPREQAWVALGIWLFECYASALQHCLAAQHEAARLAAEVDEPWLRAFELEIATRLDTRLPLVGPATRWSRIAGADWELQRALAAAAVSSAAHDDRSQTKALLGLLERVQHPTRRLRAMGIDLQVRAAAREGDVATAERLLQELDAMEGEAATLTRMRLYSRLNFLSDTGRWEAALELIERASADSRLTATQRLVMTLNFLEALESPRFGAIAEQVALIEPQLNDEESWLLEMTRTRHALRNADAQALEKLETPEGEVRLRQWQVATLRGDTVAAEALLNAVGGEAVDDEVRLLRVYAAARTHPDAELVALIRSARDEVASFSIEAQLRLLQAGAHWRLGQRAEACGLVTPEIWLLRLVPSHRALARQLLRDCPAFSTLKIAAER